MTGIVEKLGSVKLAVLGITALLTSVLVRHLWADSPEWPVSAALVLLSVNLTSALASNPRFRRQGGLLVFHLGLLLVMVLALVGETVHMSGRVEILQGQDFESRDVNTISAGSWHSDSKLAAIEFTQQAFSVDYRPDLVRGETRSQVRLAGVGTTVVGDTEPLVLGGYRFYTTSNKGYSVILTFAGEDGTHVTGTVNMPSYPLNDWKQINYWETPSGERVRLELVLPSHDHERTAWTLRSWILPPDPRLVVASEGHETTLVPGARLPVRGGQLRFERLSMWMGYHVSYDPVLPWLLAAALVALAGLAGHYRQRLARADKAALGAARRKGEECGGSWVRS